MTQTNKIGSCVFNAQCDEVVRAACPALNEDHVRDGRTEACDGDAKRSAEKVHLVNTASSLKIRLLIGLSDLWCSMPSIDGDRPSSRGVHNRACADSHRFCRSGRVINQSLKAAGQGIHWV